MTAPTTSASTPVIKDLMEQRAVAHLATVEPDGHPHVTPMWFHYDGEYFWFITPRDASKVANIRDKQTVAISISNATPPYQAVMVQGQARLADDERAGQLTEELTRRYLGDDQVQAGFGFTRREGNIAVRVEPTTMENWIQ